MTIKLRRRPAYRWHSCPPTWRARSIASASRVPRGSRSSIEQAAPVMVNLLSFVMFALGLVLCLRGYRHLGVFGLFAAGLLFFVGGAAVWHRWHVRGNTSRSSSPSFSCLWRRSAPSSSAWPHKGSSAAKSGPPSSGIAATSLYPLLLAPSGEAIYRDERPGRFMLRGHWSCGDRPSARVLPADAHVDLAPQPWLTESACSWAPAWKCVAFLRDGVSALVENAPPPVNPFS